MSEEYEQPEGARRAKSARTALLLTIVSVIINIVGATTFWMALPEKLRTTTAQLADHEMRIRADEARGNEQAGTLGRIDERTKNIQESITDLKNAVRDVKRP